MYGNLIQLSGDFTERTTWRRVTPVSSGRADTIDENRLQDILFRHAETLPLDEIDSAYETPVPVCRELGTRVGFVDALYLTPTGRIILAEFKLWRNSSARREVIGQILDYALRRLSESQPIQSRSLSDLAEGLSGVREDLW